MYAVLNSKIPKTMFIKGYMRGFKTTLTLVNH